MLRWRNESDKQDLEPAHHTESDMDDYGAKDDGNDGRDWRFGGRRDGEVLAVEGERSVWKIRWRSDQERSRD